MKETLKHILTIIASSGIKDAWCISTISRTTLLLMYNINIGETQMKLAVAFY